jgi:hypothetical protein
MGHAVSEERDAAAGSGHCRLPVMTPEVGLRRVSSDAEFASKLTNHRCLAELVFDTL